MMGDFFDWVFDDAPTWAGLLTLLLIVVFVIALLLACLYLTAIGLGAVWLLWIIVPGIVLHRAYRAARQGGEQ